MSRGRSSKGPKGGARLAPSFDTPKDEQDEQDEPKTESAAPAFEHRAEPSAPPKPSGPKRHVVQPGRSVTILKGRQRNAGDEVTADMLAGGEETLAMLVSKGSVAEV